MFVILGATGKVGRRTIKQLRSQGAPVRAVVRKSSNAEDLTALGCEIAEVDLNEASAIESAIRGAVQVICPVQAQAEDAAGAMGKTIDSIASALIEIRPPKVVAISDYGAQVSEGTGITMIFHYMEEQFCRLPSMVTFLRSAEHMQNWARVIKVASETGVLPSLHHPVGKRFPTVSAQDVGSIAAQLLTDGVTVSPPRVVHVEGPRRYDANEVAATLGNILGREVVARELLQSDWIPVLTRAGAGPSYAKLVFDLYVAHNAGRIDVEAEATDIRFVARQIGASFIRSASRPFSISNPEDRVLFIERTLVFRCQHGLALLRGDRRRGSFASNPFAQWCLAVSKPVLQHGISRCDLFSGGQKTLRCFLRPRL
jgi:NAD(P)H dehydrogenase (quinone)